MLQWSWINLKLLTLFPRYFSCLSPAGVNILPQKGDSGVNTLLQLRCSNRTTSPGNQKAPCPSNHPAEKVPVSQAALPTQVNWLFANAWDTQSVELTRCWRWCLRCFWQDELYYLCKWYLCRAHRERDRPIIKSHGAFSLKNLKSCTPAWSENRFSPCVEMKPLMFIVAL